MEPVWALCDQPQVSHHHLSRDNNPKSSWKIYVQWLSPVWNPDSGSPTTLRVFNSWCKGCLGKSKEPNCLKAISVKSCVRAISDKSCVRGISVSACLKNFLSAGDSDLSQHCKESTNQKDLQASNTKWIFLMVEVVARARVRWHPGVICSFQNRWACARGGHRSWSSSFSGSFGLGEDEGDHVFDWRWIRLRASRGEKAGEDWLSRGGMDDGRWRGDKFKIVEDEAADDDSDQQKRRNLNNRQDE